MLLWKIKWEVIWRKGFRRREEGCESGALCSCSASLHINAAPMAPLTQCVPLGTTIASFRAAPGLLSLLQSTEGSWRVWTGLASSEPPLQFSLTGQTDCPGLVGSVGSFIFNGAEQISHCCMLHGKQIWDPTSTLPEPPNRLLQPQKLAPSSWRAIQKHSSGNDLWAPIQYLCPILISRASLLVESEVPRHCGPWKM